MSAHIVNDETINAILSTARSLNGNESLRIFNEVDGGKSDLYDLNDNEAAKTLGQILLDENYRSVNSRYEESEGSHQLAFKRVVPMKAVELLRLLDYWSYQSCETNDYKERYAFKVYDALFRIGVRNLPGYKEAPWGL